MSISKLDLAKALVQAEGYPCPFCKARPMPVRTEEGTDFYNHIAHEMTCPVWEAHSIINNQHTKGGW